MALGDWRNPSDQTRRQRPPHDMDAPQTTETAAAPMTKSKTNSTLALSWSEEEIENRFGFFRPGRFTSVNKTLSFLIALVFTAVFFALITFLLNSVPAARPYAIVFVRPGNIYTT